MCEKKKGKVTPVLLYQFLAVDHSFKLPRADNGTLQLRARV